MKLVNKRNEVFFTIELTKEELNIIVEYLGNGNLLKDMEFGLSIQVAT